jgi:hypothetical protein
MRDWLDQIAPGLRQLPDTLSQLSPTVDALKDAWQNQDLTHLADLGVDAWAGFVIVFGVLWLMLALVINRVRMSFAVTSKLAKEVRPIRVRRQPWHRRFASWRRNFFVQPWYWYVGGVMTYLDQTHALIVGGSGSGKSTAVVSMILQPTIGLKMRIMRSLGFWKRRKVVVLSFDRSDPIEEATNEAEDMGMRVLRWRIRMGLGWNVLDGDREMIAEAIPTIWPESPGSTGFFSQLMSDAISQALEEIDSANRQRTWPDMIARCQRIMEEDEEVPALARKTWLRRLKSLSRVCSESLGNDFDLVSELSRDEPVIIHLSGNSYTNPKLTPLIGVAGIVQCKRAAEVVHDVILVLEEAAFLKTRRTEMDDLFRSMRARGWRILYLSQDPQDLGTVLQANAAVSLIMGLGPLARQSRQWCEDILKDLPGLAVRASELVLNVTLDQLEGYLVAGRPGVQAVSLAPYITRAAVHREHVRVAPRIEGGLDDDEAAAPQERAALAPLQQYSDELDAEVFDADAEKFLEEDEATLSIVEHKLPVAGPVAMPEWITGSRLRADQRDAEQLLAIWKRHVWPYGINGCTETSYSLSQEGSNGRPRCTYMGRQWLVYALLLAVKEGLDLNEVAMLMKARVLSVEHMCENPRCVNVERDCRWEAPGENAKLWHAHRRKALTKWQHEVETEVDLIAN